MNSSDFIKIHDLALASFLDPTISDHYRSICRWYSKEFHTPLHIVENSLPPGYVVSHYYESRLESMDEEHIDSLIDRVLNPDKEDSEEEIQEFIKKIEEEEKARLKKSTKPKRKYKKRQSLKKNSSGTSDTGPITRTYDELPPPEAGSDLDSMLGPTPLVGTRDDSSDL